MSKSTKKQRQAVRGARYLICESELYESDTIHFVCDDEETAKAVVTTIAEFMERLARRLPDYPPYDVKPDENGRLFDIVHDKREAILDCVKWPFGLTELRHRVPAKDRKFVCITWRKVDRWIGSPTRRPKN